MSLPHYCQDAQIDWILNRPDFAELVPDTSQLTTSIIKGANWWYYMRLKQKGYKLPYDQNYVRCHLFLYIYNTV